MSETLQLINKAKRSASKKIAHINRELLSYKRELLAGLLNQCTLEQRDIFYRMYPSVAEIPESKIDWAVQQCERTIECNKIKEINND